MNSYCRKIILFLFVLILIFISLEMLLRGVSLFFDNDNIDLSHTENLRILTLGESTTADSGALDLKSWPRLLQANLNKLGLNTIVINKAVSGTSTSIIVKKLPKMIIDYKPNIVISMMGINDYPQFWLNETGLISKGEFFHDLRVIKLLKYVKHRTFSPIIKEPIYPNKLNYPNVKLLISQAKEKSDQVDREIKVFLKDKSPKKQAEFYYFLYTKLTSSWDSPVSEFDLAFKYLKKSLEIKLEPDVRGEIFALIAELSNRKSDCHWIASLFIEKNMKPSHITLHRLARCSPNASSIQLLLKKYSNHIVLKKDSRLKPTKANYNKMYRFLKKQDVCLIAMQYPLTPLSRLKEYFREKDLSDNLGKKIFFIGNEENFNKALSRYSFDQLFYDRFADTFGHSTAIGNQLIADNVTSLVRDIIDKNLCKN